MNSLNLLIGVSLIYCALFFIDYIFKTCSHFPYLYFLQHTGLEVGFLKVRWFTAVFNKTIQKWGNLRPRLLHGWFILGSWLSIAMLPVAVYLVFHSTQNVLFKSDHVNTSAPVMTLEPVVPGITLPVDDLGYYVATLAICSIVHEMGHALAAVRERVRVFGVGLAVMLILPVAYVELSTEQLQALPPCRQLCVMAAGVWHNIVLTGIAVCLSSALPFLFSPLFATNIGISVTHITAGSSLDGITGLKEGDHLIAINNCNITHQLHWEQCIRKAISQPNSGFCITEELKSIGESKEDQCCPESETHHLCFQRSPVKHYSCLRARAVIESSMGTCTQAADCSTDQYCLVPKLGDGNKLVRIYQSNTQPVLFLGHPAEIYQYVEVTEYVPLYSWVSSRLPRALTRLCDYVITLSAGLAVINLIPCYWFDGQHIVTALTNLLLLKVAGKRTREAIAFSITLAGTLLLSVCLVATMYNVVTR